MLLFFVVLLASFSVADKSGLAWYGIRALLFLAVGGEVLWRRRAHLPSLAAGLGFLAAGGYPALDYSLAALCFGAFASGPARPRRWWCVAAILVASCAALALALSYTPYGEGARTAGGPLYAGLFPFHNRNHFAVFAEIFFPLLLWQWKKHRAWPYAAGAALLVLSSLAGGSRAGALVLAVEVLILAWVWGGKRALLTAGLGAAAVASVFILGSNPERIRDPLAGDHRLEIWRSSVHMIAAKPLSGWGANEFAGVYPAYAVFDNGQSVAHAHSDWLEWATEFGVAGPLLLAGLLYLYARKVQHHPWAWGILFGALHATVDFAWHLPGLMLFTVAFTGAAVRHVQEPTNP